MPDYIPYTADEYQPDAPGTALHFSRWFQNWEAGADGALGAPRFKGRSLDLHLGHLVQANTTPVTLLGLDRCELIWSLGHWQVSTSRQYKVAFTADGGASWGSYQSILPISEPSVGDRLRHFRLNLRTGAWLMTNAAAGAWSGSVTPLAGCNGLRLNGDNSSGMSFAADFFCIGGLTG